MHQDERPERLLARAQAYLRDAANEANSTHTRYASAMNALGCLYRAGIASAEDWRQVMAWEATRYDLAAGPTLTQVEGMMRRVRAILPRDAARQ